MKTRRHKGDIPDSVLMKPYQYAIWTAFFFLAAIGLIGVAVAAIIGWIPNGNVFINALCFISAMSGLWLGYLGVKATAYSREKKSSPPS